MFKIILALLSSVFVQAATIQEASFDNASQTLQLQVFYTGGLKAHQFTLEWDACQTINGVQQIAARLIDTGWDDTGVEEFGQTLSFDLSAVSCKPAELTLFSDRYSRQTLWID